MAAFSATSGIPAGLKYLVSSSSKCPAAATMALLARSRVVRTTSSFHNGTSHSFHVMQQHRATRSLKISSHVRMMSVVSSDSDSDNGDSLVRTIERKIKKALEPEALQVIPAYGDPNGSHVSISVVSEKFNGLLLMKRHQLVYKAIWDEMSSGALHAVDALDTKTPAEFLKSQQDDSD